MNDVLQLPRDLQLSRDKTKAVAECLTFWRRAHEDGADIFNCLFRMDLARRLSDGTVLTCEELGVAATALEALRESSYRLKLLQCVAKLRESATFGAFLHLKIIVKILPVTGQTLQNIRLTEEDFDKFGCDGWLEHARVYLSYLRYPGSRVPCRTWLCVMHESLDKAGAGYDELGTSDQEVHGFAGCCAV